MGQWGCHGYIYSANASGYCWWFVKYFLFIIAEAAIKSLYFELKHRGKLVAESYCSAETLAVSKPIQSCNYFIF